MRAAFCVLWGGGEREIEIGIEKEMTLDQEKLDATAFRSITSPGCTGRPGASTASIERSPGGRKKGEGAGALKRLFPNRTVALTRETEKVSMSP